jgi:hypothetical protein
MPQKNGLAEGIAISGLTDELESAQYSTAVGLIMWGARNPGTSRQKKMPTLSLPNAGSFGRIASNLPLKNILPKVAGFIKSFLP